MSTVLPRSANFSQKSSSHCKILDTKSVTRNKLHYWYAQILGSSIQTYLTTVIWCLGFLESYRQNFNVSDNRIMPVCGSVFSNVLTFSCVQWPGWHAQQNKYQHNQYSALATGWMSTMPGNDQKFLFLESIKSSGVHPVSHWLGIRHKTVEAWRTGQECKKLYNHSISLYGKALNYAQRQTH